MKKRILCAIMSAVMVVGMMTGCGSTSVSKDDTSVKEVSSKEKVADSIMTEIIPGESTADELETYLQDKGITWENDREGQPGNCTNTDYFLGHEALFDEFNYKKGTVYGYVVEVAFKDVDDYKNGLKEIKEYFENMGTGITGYNDDEGGDKEPIKCYLLEDETDHYTAVLPWVSTYDEMEGDYYNSMIKFAYYRVDKRAEAGETVLWTDGDGKAYTTKFDKANGNSVESTEASKETNKTLPAWKQAYVDYINSLDSDVTDYQFIYVNSDDIPELYINIDGNEAGILNYMKSGDVQFISALYKYSRFAYNNDGKIMDGYKNIDDGTVRDIVYSYDTSTGGFEKVFDGTYEGYGTGTFMNYCFHIQGDTETTQDEYESKLNEAKGNSEYTTFEDGTSFGDVISAIQNRK